MDKLDSPKEVLPATKTDEKENLLVETTLQKINRSPQKVDYPQVEKTKANPQVTAKDFMEALRDLPRFRFEKIISIFKKLFRGGTNRVEGLGLKLIDKLETNSEKAQIATQLRKINQPESWEDKIGVSHASFLHETSLHRAGYRVRNAKTSAVISVSAGQKIKELVDANVWEQIKGGDVLNALDFENPLPGSADTKYYLHLDAKDFPIYLSDKEGENHEALLFEKEKDESKQAEMKEDSKLEVLKNKLEPGDIIWTYKKDSVVLPQLIRAGQNPDFPFTHMLIYLGNGMVGQIHAQGGERFSLAEMVGSGRNYKTLCAGELVGEDKTDFVKEVKDWIDKTQDYAESVYFDASNHALRGKPLKKRMLKKGDSAVCTDLLRAAKNPELRELLDGGETRPYEFFKLGFFRAKYSISNIDD
jgi:hypothetical protein